MKTTGGKPVAGRPPRKAGAPPAHRAHQLRRDPPDVLQHLGTVLSRQWRRYRKRLQRCQQNFSEAAVHDSRVETRRLLATLDLLAAFIPAGELRKPRRALKKHLDAFDDLRDTQVQLAVLKPVRRVSPTAPAFHAWLRHREVRFIREARQAVKQIKTRRVGERIVAFEVDLGCQRKRTPPERAFRIAQDVMRLAFARVGRLCRRVKAADPRTIHRTRIAFKRFRYMVEALSPLLPAVTDKHLQALRRYQAMMGEIQDFKVLLTALDKFLEQGNSDPATQRLRAEFVRRREQLVRGYVNAAPQLWLFWPPKASSPRPTADKVNQP